MLTEDQKTRHLPHLQPIADADVAQLRQKDAEYGASWKSRGGVGAFMMIARKWDRLENMVKELRRYSLQNNRRVEAAAGDREVIAGSYDIFSHVLGSELERGDAESLRDTLGDLRRYCLLVEAEVDAAQGRPVLPCSGRPPVLPEPQPMVDWLNAHGRFTVNKVTGEAEWRSKDVAAQVNPDYLPDVAAVRGPPYYRSAWSTDGTHPDPAVTHRPRQAL